MQWVPNPELGQRDPLSPLVWQINHDIRHPIPTSSILDPGRPLWYGQEILLRGHPISLPLEPYLGAACGDEQGLRRVGLSSAGLPGCVRLDTREKYTSSCSTLSPALNLASGDPWCPVLGARPSTKKHTVGSPNHCFQI